MTERLVECFYTLSSPWMYFAGPQLRSIAEKKLVRRIDLRLLPMLVLMYIMNYLDRNNIAAARVTGEKGLQKDLGMTDTQYQVG